MLLKAVDVVFKVNELMKPIESKIQGLKESILTTSGFQLLMLIREVRGRFGMSGVRLLAMRRDLKYG